MISRRSILANPRPSDGLLSRDGMFFLTLILLLTLTASVFIGSVLPTITEAFTDQRFEAGPAWFDRVTGPQFALLVLLIGVCPLLGRAASALRQLRARGLPAIIGTIAATIIAALAGFTQPLSLIGFAVIGLAGATTVMEIIRDTAARSRRLEESPLQALWTLFGRNRRKYGGYLVHTGVILMALGVVGTRMYPLETEEVLSSGDPVTVGEYTLVFEELQYEPADDHMTTRASLAVYRDGEYLTTLQPTMDQYSGFDMTVATPALRTGLRQDLYVVLAGWEGRGTATFKVFVNSLASFLWLGGLIFLTGGAVALWPPAQKARLPAPQARRRAIGSSVGLAVGLLVLAVAIVTMWGSGLGMAESFAGRPLPGQPAPDFALDLLDGSTLALSDLRGQVVVVNLWATWCPPCEDELPDLQTVWEEYEVKGVAFVGIVYQDQETAVRDFIARFGLTYPMGMDRGNRIYAAYGATGIPETFVIDSQGQVADFHIGPVSAEQLRKEIDSLLGE